MKLIARHDPPLPALRHVTVHRWHGDDPLHHEGDALAVEEPLEIRLAGWSVAVTMRTPGDDFELAAGFLYTEGIIAGRQDIATIAYCPDEAGESSNIVNVNPADPASVQPERWQRHFFANSSCGICGKASIESVCRRVEPVRSELQVDPATLYRLDGELRQAQQVFGQTGGLHAAGLFTAGGTLLVVREDVGRHNAVDKVIGHALLNGSLPLERHILFVSGRLSFEVVQKALMARIPLVVAVSAPSSLAVDLAQEANMTLVGFLRTGNGTARCNVYAGAERVSNSPAIANLVSNGR